MITPQDKYFKELAEIYSDYESPEAGKDAIFSGLQRAFVFGRANGRLFEVNKRLRKLEKENG